MPNYGLVVTPTYNPMSYEQYIQPFKDYAQVYNATVDQIDALEMEANQWERLADSDIDAPQYAQYKSYADDLRKYANEIATQGLSSRTRAGLSRMRQRYAKEIKPIEEAFNYRQKMAEEQRKLNPKGDIQWDVDFSNIGLGAIMANPSMGYSGRSLSEMEQEGFEQAKALSTRRLSDPAKAMSGQYFMIRQGFSAEEAEEWLANQSAINPQAASEAAQYIDSIYEQVKKSYGTDGTDSRYSTAQNIDADKRIASGILKGLVLQDSYQANRGWTPAGKDDEGNGGSVEDGGKVIGYEVAYKTASGNEKRYTVVNTNQGKEYYNVDGTPETNKEIIKILDTSPLIAKYKLRPHKENQDIVDIVDVETGMPLSQDNAIISFDKTTHDFDVVRKQLVSKGYSTDKIISIQTDGTVGYYDKIEDAYNASSRLKDKESVIIEATEITGDTRGASTNSDYKVIKKQLEKKAPEVIKNPSNYIIQYSMRGKDKVSLIAINKKLNKTPIRQ